MTGGEEWATGGDCSTIRAPAFLKSEALLILTAGGANVDPSSYSATSSSSSLMTTGGSSILDSLRVLSLTAFLIANAVVSASACSLADFFFSAERAFVFSSALSSRLSSAIAHRMTRGRVQHTPCRFSSRAALFRGEPRLVRRIPVESAPPAQSRSCDYCADCCPSQRVASVMYR